MPAINHEVLHDDGAGALVLATVAQQAVEPKKLEHNTPYAVLQEDGSLAIQVTDHRKPEPLTDHVKASRHVVDPESFVAYVERHHDAGTEIYADLERSSVIALVDGPVSSTEKVSRDRAGREAHLVTLSLAKTKPWTAWAAQDGKWLTQVEFAEHIEDNLPDIIVPAAADMLELAQTFSAKRDVEFKSSQRLSTGETKISYTEDTDARAGRGGDIEIPEQFVIGVIPFVGGTSPYRVKARFRYRLRDGDLMLGYKLDRPDAVLEDAFGDILAAIKDGLAATDVPVFHGRRD